MSVRILLAFLFLLSSQLTCAAQEENGLGIILGEPTGITGKHWLNADRALDAGLSYSFNNFFLIYGDYLFHFSPNWKKDLKGENLRPYVGVGGELFFSTNSGRTDRALYTDNGATVGFAIRIPLGLEWILHSAPIGFFVELVPALGIIPETFGAFGAGIGARYYF